MLPPSGVPAVGVRSGRAEPMSDDGVGEAAADGFGVLTGPPPAVADGAKGGNSFWDAPGLLLIRIGFVTQTAIRQRQPPAAAAAIHLRGL